MNAKAFRWSRGYLKRKRGLVRVVIGCCDWIIECTDLVGANLRRLYTILRAQSSCVARRIVQQLALHEGTSFLKQPVAWGLQRGMSQLLPHLLSWP